jgi:hypothetical protein
MSTSRLQPRSGAVQTSHHGRGGDVGGHARSTRQRVVDAAVFESNPVVVGEGRLGDLALWVPAVFDGLVGMQKAVLDVAETPVDGWSRAQPTIL